VQKVGYSAEEANALLERAFGWRTQTFWRGLKKEEVPKAEAVAATLNLLKELGELTNPRHSTPATPGQNPDCRCLRDGKCAADRLEVCKQFVHIEINLCFF
jgi:hypothetical protein